MHVRHSRCLNYPNKKKSEKKRVKAFEWEKRSVRIQNHSLCAKSLCLSVHGSTHCSTAYMNLLSDSHHVSVTDICIAKIFQDVLVSGVYFHTMKFDLQGWNVRLHWCFTFQALCERMPWEINNYQNPTPIAISKVPHIY